MKNQNLVTTIVLIIVFTAAGFFGGMQYQKSKQPIFGNRQFGQGQGQGQRQGNGSNRMNGFRPVNGEILSSDDKSITVKLQDGSSKIVLFSDKTTINKASEGAVADLKVGEKVAVFGSDNSDGSVSAQSIQLNPVMRAFGSPDNITGTPSPQQ